MFAFDAGESIHTENSYKYTDAAFRAVVEAAGFTPLKLWTDERAWFAVYYVEA